jgi:hypothetical protein
LFRREEVRVDKRDYVERVVVVGQVLHVPSPEVALRSSSASDLEQRGRGIETRNGRAARSSQRACESGATSHIQQSCAVPQFSEVVDCFEEISAAFVFDLGPVARPRAPEHPLHLC